MNIHTMTAQEFARLYRSYKNDFITIGGFADYYGLEDEDAMKVINIGRICHESGF